MKYLLRVSNLDGTQVAEKCPDVLCDQSDAARYIFRACWGIHEARFHWQRWELIEINADGLERVIAEGNEDLGNKGRVDSIAFDASWELSVRVAKRAFPPGSFDAVCQDLKPTAESSWASGPHWG